MESSRSQQMTGIVADESHAKKSWANHQLIFWIIIYMVCMYVLFIYIYTSCFGIPFMILRFSHFQSMFSQFSPISCCPSYQATELLVDLAEDDWKSRKIWCPKGTNMFRPSRYIAGSWTQQKGMINTVKNPNHTGIQKLPMLRTCRRQVPLFHPFHLQVGVPNPRSVERWGATHSERPGIATPKGWKHHETHRRIASKAVKQMVVPSLLGDYIWN